MWFRPPVRGERLLRRACFGEIPGSGSAKTRSVRECDRLGSGVAAKGWVARGKFRVSLPLGVQTRMDSRVLSDASGIATLGHDSDQCLDVIRQVLSFCPTRPA